MIDDISQKVFENLMNTDQMQKIQNSDEIFQQIDAKLKELEVNIVKLSEDGEGRDGLILQQN